MSNTEERIRAALDKCVYLPALRNRANDSTPVDARSLLTSEQPARGQPAPYRPWDRQDLYRRAHSYKASTWFCKPESVSPIICARYGWINVARDSLECEFCRAKLMFPSLPSMSPDALQKAAQQFTDKLQSSHDTQCPWVAAACDVRLAQFPPLPYVRVAEEYSERLAQLCAVEALPAVDEALFEGLDEQTRDRLHRFAVNGPSTSGALEPAGVEQDKLQRARVYALFGWHVATYRQRVGGNGCALDMRNALLHCTICGNKAGLEMLLSPQPASRTRIAAAAPGTAAAPAMPAGQISGAGMATAATGEQRSPAACLVAAQPSAPPQQQLAALPPPVADLSCSTIAGGTLTQAKSAGPSPVPATPAAQPAAQRLLPAVSPQAVADALGATIAGGSLGAGPGRSDRSVFLPVAAAASPPPLSTRGSRGQEGVVDSCSLGSWVAGWSVRPGSAGSHGAAAAPVERAAGVQPPADVPFGSTAVPLTFGRPAAAAVSARPAMPAPFGSAPTQAPFGLAAVRGGEQLAPAKRSRAEAEVQSAAKVLRMTPPKASTSGPTAAPAATPADANTSCRAVDVQTQQAQPAVAPSVMQPRSTAVGLHAGGARASQAAAANPASMHRTYCPWVRAVPGGDPQRRGWRWCLDSLTGDGRGVASDAEGTEQESTGQQQGQMDEWTPVRMLSRVLPKLELHQAL